MNGARSSVIRDNAISVGWQGVLLNSEASRNLVIGNSILAIQEGGIALEAGVRANTIRSNLVACAAERSCLTVDIQPEEMEMNTIQDNRP